MPYKSVAQAAYMHINHPEIASKWGKEYPEHKPGTLPQHVGDKKPLRGLKKAHPKSPKSK